MWIGFLLSTTTTLSRLSCLCCLHSPFRVPLSYQRFFRPSGHQRCLLPMSLDVIVDDSSPLITYEGSWDSFGPSNNASSLYVLFSHMYGVRAPLTQRVTGIFIKPSRQPGLKMPLHMSNSTGAAFPSSAADDTIMETSLSRWMVRQPFSAHTPQIQYRTQAFYSTRQR